MDQDPGELVAGASLTPELVALIAERFKALGEPARLQITKRRRMLGGR